MNASLRAFLVLLTCVSSAFSQFGFSGKSDRVTPSLVANTTAIVPGKPFTVLVQLKMKEGWHVYWQYGGDSGLAPSAKWQLPEGFTAGPIQWPLPTKHDDADTDQTTYIYEHEVALPVEITPPAQIAEKEVTLKANLQWLVCEKICVPGRGDVSITLPVAVGGQAAEANAELFAVARSRLPKSDPPPFRSKWEVKPDAAAITVSGLPKDATIDFFPLPSAGARPGHATVGEPNAQADRTISFPVKSEGTAETPWQGLIVTRIGDGPQSGWMLSAPASSSPSAQPQPSTTPPPKAGEQSQANPLQDRNFITWLGVAFLGGLILNLMPCVLPVISLKIFSFVNQAAEAPSRVLKLGISFVAGVYVFFLGLSIVAIVLGNRFVWGSQFEPRAVLILIALTLVFALAMFGMFEITLGSTVENTLGNLSRKEGYTGAFLQGLFTTLLGTSCTAPFIAPALGFIAGKPAHIILPMFMAMATGLSLPYVLLAANPKWLRFLPKPGVWMDHFKHFMGFVLLAVVAWLFGIFAELREAAAVSAAGWFFVCLAVACWIYGLGRRSAKSLAIGLLIVGVAGWFFIPQALTEPEKPRGGVAAQGKPNELGIVWEPFSPELVNEALKAQKPVFIDFTATWCWNCKVIEKAVINTAPIAAAFKEKEVVTIKADWTRFDPVITEWLKKFNRIGVPVYVLYRPGEAQPIVLPDVPTQSGLLEELSKIGPAS